MLIELKGAMLNVQNGRTQIMTDDLRECTYCHCVTRFFENVQGETRCLACPSRLPSRR